MSRIVHGWGSMQWGVSPWGGYIEYTGGIDTSYNVFKLEKNVDGIVRNNFVGIFSIIGIKLSFLSKKYFVKGVLKQFLDVIHKVNGGFINRLSNLYNVFGTKKIFYSFGYKIKGIIKNNISESIITKATLIYSLNYSTKIIGKTRSIFNLDIITTGKKMSNLVKSYTLKGKKDFKLFLISLFDL